MVEKAPVVILKAAKKADAEPIIKKLTENGAKLNLK
jgi:ribosomal protein L7/L12